MSSDFLRLDGPTPCRSNPDLFEDTPELFQAAKSLCIGQCRQRAACLEFAMRTGQRDRVWGGLTPAERKTRKHRAAHAGPQATETAAKRRRFGGWAEETDMPIGRHVRTTEQLQEETA